MAYKIFISHSVENQSLIIFLSNFLAQCGIKVFVGEWYLTPEELLSKNVFKQIEKANVIILLINKGNRLKWVQQEIDYAIENNKIVIPYVKKNIPSKYLPILQGEKYIEYDYLQPYQSLIEMSTYIKSLKLGKKLRETLFFSLLILSLIFLPSEK